MKVSVISQQRKKYGISELFRLLLLRFFQFSFVVCISSCSKDPALWEIENLNNNTVSAFGHGGMGIGFKYPIDYYESFEPCMRIGADGTEMDVQPQLDSRSLVKGELPVLVRVIPT